MLSLEQTHLHTTTSLLPLGTRRSCVGQNRVFFSARHDSNICMHLIYSKAVILVPERVNVFYMAVNCEWAHGSERVCGSRGASSRTGPVYRETFFFTLRLSIPELGSTHSLLDLHISPAKQHRERKTPSERRQASRWSS